MSANCSICRDTKQVKVGWSPAPRSRYGLKVEYDRCLACTPPPHSFHVKQVMQQIKELRDDLAALAELKGDAKSG